MSGSNDPIADLLTKIRNAQTAKQRFVDLPWSKMKEAIVKILKGEGFVAHYLVKEEDRKMTMRVFLKYGPDRKAVINGLKRVSRVSCRKYVTADEIPTIMGGMGISIVSTSQGVLDGKTAKEKRAGGELLCIAW